MIYINCNPLYSLDLYQTTTNVPPSAKEGMNRYQWITALETVFFEWSRLRNKNVDALLPHQVQISDTILLFGMERMCILKTGPSIHSHT